MHKQETTFCTLKQLASKQGTTFCTIKQLASSLHMELYVKPKPVSKETFPVNLKQLTRKQPTFYKLNQLASTQGTILCTLKQLASSLHVKLSVK